MCEAYFTIGAKIKKLREEIGLTQKELSIKLGISKSTLGMYETDKREPNLITIKKLCSELYTDGNYLVGCSSVPHPNKTEQLTMSESLLLDNYRNLNDEGQKYIDKTMFMALSAYKNQTIDNNASNSIAKPSIGAEIADDINKLMNMPTRTKSK